MAGTTAGDVVDTAETGTSVALPFAISAPSAVTAATAAGPLAFGVNAGDGSGEALVTNGEACGEAGPCGVVFAETSLETGVLQASLSESMDIVLDMR